MGCQEGAPGAEGAVNLGIRGGCGRIDQGCSAKAGRVGETPLAEGTPRAAPEHPQGRVSLRHATPACQSRLRGSWVKSEHSCLTAPPSSAHSSQASAGEGEGD